MGSDDSNLRAQIDTLSSKIAELQRTCTEIRALVGPFGLPWPDDTVLVQRLHAVKYFIDGNDLVMAPHLVIYRQWESDLTDFFLQLVTPQTIFVDVGANFGYFACLLASRIGCVSSGRVIAIEANPKMVELL